MAPRGLGTLCLVLAITLQEAFRAAALPATVSGRTLLVEGAPLHIKGVNWNPIPIGGVHPVGLSFRDHVNLDGDLLKASGANVIRTYEPLTDLAVLDALWARGIQVINTVWDYGSVPPSVVAAAVNAVKGHPAILMWSVGNEWNYNLCYMKEAGMSFEQCMDKIAEVVAVVKANDDAHPVASVYGELPCRDVISRLSSVDVWGINYYDEISFSDLFDRWAAVSTKPMFIGEYGADAYNALIGAYDPGSQAHATSVLTQELVDHSTVLGGVCLGGIIFELADEWWKDGTGSPHTQDVGGIAPGGGPYPDRTFNEEWWGLVEIDRTPREAFHAFANVQPPKPPLLAARLHAEGAARLHCTLGGCTAVQGRRPAALEATTPAEASVTLPAVLSAMQANATSLP